MLTAFQLDAFQTCAFQEEASAGIPAPPTKIGGDDVPREEHWEKRKKRKKTDESLTLAIESAYKQIMGEEPTPEIVAEIKQEIPEPPPIPKQDYSKAKEWIEQQLRIIESRIEQMREEEEEEAILLLM